MEQLQYKEFRFLIQIPKPQIAKFGKTHFLQKFQKRQILCKWFKTKETQKKFQNPRKGSIEIKLGI
jgi:hypothetical protein